jgi:hypothetical protein
VPIRNELPSSPLDQNGTVIYLLRSAQQNHVSLSAIADQKSSFLLGAAFVSLNIVLGKAATDGGKLSPALIIFALTSFVAATFAVMALIPRAIPRRDLKHNFNHLFFGHFAELPEEEFMRTMRELCSSEEEILKAMLRDLYQIGQVLHYKKYRYLGMGYRTFLGGLAATLVAAVTSYFST